MSRLSATLRFMKAIASIIGISSLLIVCSASGQSVSDARALFKEGKYQESLEILNFLSDSGNPEAQFDLGNLYLFGVAVKASQDKGESLWLKSCNNGFLAACTNIGQRYYSQKNYSEAKKVLIRAAEGGDTLAAKYLAEWFEKSEWQGSSSVINK